MSNQVSNQPQQPQAVKKFEEVTVDSVLKRVASFQETGDLVLPANYIPENAVRAAWLVLQETVDTQKRPALEVCTKESIANAFLDMITKGLSVTKKQGYFVVYGNKLQFDESYIGSITIAKRDAGVKEVNAVTIYKKDVFEYSNDPASGRKRVIKHEQKLENIIPEEIVGAYAIVTYNDGTIDTEIMTVGQIHKAWDQGGSKGSSPAHKNFPDQMAEKTVISRALKIESGSADDSAILRDRVEAGVNHEIKEKANKKSLSLDDETIDAEAEEVKEEQTQEAQPEAPRAENVEKQPSQNTPTGPGF